MCSAGSPAVEGALAPDLSRRPMRSAVEPLRELPGKRRRERTWKDEVRERVDRRRKEVRGEPGHEAGEEPGLPLFPETRPATPARPEVPVRRAERRPARSAPTASPEPEAPARRAGPPSAEGPSLLDPLERAHAGPAERVLDDLPLHTDLNPGTDNAPHPDPLALLGDPPGLDSQPAQTLLDPAPSHGLSLDDETGVEALPPRTPPARTPAPELALDEAEEDWQIDSPAAHDHRDVRPVERPARAFERLQAAVIDVGLLIGLAALVVYFAARVAQVPVAGLRPAWPFVAAYLAFLGLTYASYFTGTTGQTVGKILLGLRVVDTSGHAPGYRCALARGVLGTLGTLGAGLGLVTVLFDPAHRAVHDRLLRTRVISLRRQ